MIVVTAAEHLGNPCHQMWAVLAIFLVIAAVGTTIAVIRN